MGAPRTTSLTVVVRPDHKDSAKSFRGTFHSDGLFRRTSGVAPLFDPEKAQYATTDHVINVIAASAGDEHPIILRGDEMSSSRLANATIHSWKKWLTLDEMLEHKYLGKTAPSKATIVEAYRVLRSTADGIEG